MGSCLFRGRGPAPVSPGLVIVPLPMDTLATLLLILLVFGVVLVSLVDRPDDGGRTELGRALTGLPCVDRDANCWASD